jgi:enamine deaminase RidA (YjgF/YER057c/UK114 family)
MHPARSSTPGISRARPTRFSTISGKPLATVHLSLQDLLQITIYVTDARFRDELRAISIKHMDRHLPASTLVVVAGLAEPEFLIEIDAIAADRV